MPDTTQSVWGHQSFVETLQGNQATLQLYLGEDDEREFDEIEELCATFEVSAENSGSASPVVPISVEKYYNLFKPWWGALVLKLLGKNVFFRTMEQRALDLWKLEASCELIDLDKSTFWHDFSPRPNL